MGPLLGAALAAGGTSLLGGFLNWLGGTSANNKNVAMQQATNAAQERMFNRALEYNTLERLDTQDWNLEQWARNNEYNSPANQALRLRNAGFNPAAIMNGNSYESAPVQTSPVTAPSSPSFTAPSVAPQNFDFVGQAAQAAVDVYGRYQQAKGLAIDNDTRVQRNMLELNERQQSLANAITSGKLSKQSLKAAKLEYHQNLVRLNMLKFDESRQNIAAQQSDEMFNATMQKFKDEHDAAELATVTQQLMNSLAIRLDARQERELQSVLERTKGEMELMRKNGQKVDGEIALQRFERLLKTSQLPSALLDGFRKLSTLKTRQGDKGFRTIDNFTDYVLSNSLERFFPKH